MRKSRNILLLLLVGFVMMACQEVVRPDGIINADDFEDILYDIHLSHYIEYDKIQGDTLSVEARRYALTLDVLKKWNVTQAEWDSSMVYYTRHSPELKEIYNNVFDRLKTVAEDIGATVGDGSADSTDIWPADRHLLLTSQRGYTTNQWTIKTDTLLKAGEKLNLQYLLLFLNTQTQNRLMSVIAIRLNNDSVIVRNQVSSQTGIFSITIEDDKKIGIKSVSGYFMVMHPQNAMFGGVEDAKQVNSNQIVVVQDIHLTHQSSSSAPPAANVANDSIQPQMQPDGQHDAPGGQSVPPSGQPQRPNGITLSDHPEPPRQMSHP